jgi:hypothetical protein
MKNETIKWTNFLISGLTLGSCLISITNNDIYEDGEWANAQWLGQDIVTLIIALPLLLISIIQGFKSENKKWFILNIGILLYFSYTYSFYVFAAKLTFLYLFHIPIYGLSVIGLVLSCIHIFSQKSSFYLPQKGLRITIISYLSVIALMISFIWLSDIFSHLTNPEHKSDTPYGEAPLIIYSLDLAIIIPLMLISAVLLYKRTNWGHIISGIILTKTSTLGFALMAMALSMYIQDLNTDSFLILLWCVIGLIGTIITTVYLKNLRIDEDTTPDILYKKH